MRDLWEKARTAARSARMLLEAGDSDGVVSRAYYAMFDVARAVLAREENPAATAKTQATVIREFSRHMLQSGKIDTETTRALHRGFEIRLIADYSAEQIQVGDARMLVESMERFLEAVAAAEESDGGPP